MEHILQMEQFTITGILTKYIILLFIIYNVTKFVSKQVYLQQRFILSEIVVVFTHFQYSENQKFNPFQIYRM